MKVAILADSNALPRGKGWGDLQWESTYPFQLDQLLRLRLKSTLPFVIERGMRYRTMPDVLADWQECVELRGCDYAIVQVGGADCAPRVLLPREREWVKRFFPRFLSHRLLQLEDKYRRAILRRYPHRVCVPAKRFENATRALVSRAEHYGLKKLILVNIFDPSPAVLEQFAGAKEKIHRYNQILEGLAAAPHVNYVDLHSIVRTLPGMGKFTSDGLHLAPEGQRKLAETLCEILLRDWRSRRALDENTHSTLGTAGDHFNYPYVSARTTETVPLE